MDDYINRQEAIKNVKEYVTEMECDIYYGSHLGVPEDDIEDALNEVPAADVQEIKHGYWTRIDYMPIGHDYQCSICNNKNDRNSNFCPDCGAKMDKEKPNEV